MASPSLSSRASPAFPTPPPLDQALRRVEGAIQDFSTALLQGQADMAEAAARNLQQHSVALGQPWAQVRRAMPGWKPGPAVAARLQAVHRTLGQQREASLRCGGMAERALQAIMPAARNAPYGAAGGPGYARGQARQSGAFRLLSA